MKKRFFSLLLALIMMFALSGGVPAFAAATEGAGITVKAPGGRTLNGHKIELFRVFDLDWDGEVGEDEPFDGLFSYTFTEGFRGFLDFCAVENIEPFDGFDGLTDLVYYLEGKLSYTKPVRDFARAVQQYIETPGSGYTAETGDWLVTDPATIDTKISEYTWEEASLGYWLILDTYSGRTDAAALLTNNAKTGEYVVTLKLDVPSIDKTVSDDGGDVWRKYGTEYSGQSLKYRLVTAVPQMQEYETYKFIIWDIIGAGLDFDETSVEITVGGETLTPGDDYSATLVANTVKFEFSDFYGNFLNRAGETIIVSYDASINEAAVFALGGDSLDGMINEAYIEYGGDLEDEETPKSAVNVYSFGIDVYKFAGTLGDGDEALEGVEFELFKYDPVPLNKMGAQVKFTYDGGVYTHDLEGEDNELATGADGMIYLRGLKAGTYWLVETKTLAGFNGIEPVMVRIVPAYDELDELEDVEYYVTMPGGVEDLNGGHVVNIENKSGSRLPDSGGIGTIVFTVAGAGMMLGVITILALRGRKKIKG